MADQFLSQLLRMENSVQSDKGHKCYICLSEYGKMSPETGIIECEIRLPCNPNHACGSACIATWLKSHNTCPMCRHVFFPQSEDDSESEDTDEINTNDRNRGMRVADTAPAPVDPEHREYQRARSARTSRISAFILSYCAALQLNNSVEQLSQDIRGRAEDSVSQDGRSETTIAAACVYTASHLRGQPKSLGEISRLAGSSECSIQTVYRRIYALHHSLPEPTWRRTFGVLVGLARTEDRDSANWPPLEHDFSDGSDDDEECIQAIWSRFSAGLDLPPAVTAAAKRMAIKMETWPTLALEPPTSLAAISIYLASYMVESPVSHVSIASVAGFADTYMLFTYERVYPDRERLYDSSMTALDLPDLPGRGRPPF